MDTKLAHSSATAESPLHDGNRLSAATLVRLFPYPVMHYDWPESDGLNDRLKEIILNTRSSSAGVVKTNRGGWQSTTDLEKWVYPEITDLLGRIRALAQQYLAQALGAKDDRFDSGWLIRAWANVNQRGNFNRTHDHLGRYSFLSGIYYVDVGDVRSDDSVGGRTVFEDWANVPVSILDDPDLSRTNFCMTPRNGRMVLFPASLMHSVETYSGSRPRISIAFNLHHPGLGVAHLRDRELSAHWGWRNFRGVMILRQKIPEKIVALGLVPGVLSRMPLPRPLSFRRLYDHVRTCIDHAFALASERFENR